MDLANLHQLVGSPQILILLLGGVFQEGLTQTFPEPDQLPELTALPDPLRFQDGRPVQDRSDWEKRRKEIKGMLQFYEYGHFPPPPGNVQSKVISETPRFGGTATERRLLLRFGPEQRLTMNVNLIVPSGRGPFAVIIKNDMRLGFIPIARELTQLGYIAAEYVVTDLDPDQADTVGPAQAAYPDYDWGTLAVWAWGGMRLVDYLMTLDVVDQTRIAVTGHSRGGKAALLHGAFDDRVALTVPNGSGAGGAGCYRLGGSKVETLELITRPERFGYWFHPRLRGFVGRENRLPFDQHFLKALVAPRALLSTEARGDLWANPIGTQKTYLAADKVFEFLGGTDRNGLAYREGKHDQTVEDWQALLAFMELQFRGKQPPDGRDFKKLPYPEE